MKNKALYSFLCTSLICGSIAGCSVSSITETTTAQNTDAETTTVVTVETTTEPSLETTEEETKAPSHENQSDKTDETKTDNPGNIKPTETTSETEPDETTEAPNYDKDIVVLDEAKAIGDIISGAFTNDSASLSLKFKYEDIYITDDEEEVDEETIINADLKLDGLGNAKCSLYIDEDFPIGLDLVLYDKTLYLDGSSFIKLLLEDFLFSDNADAEAILAQADLKLDDVLAKFKLYMPLGDLDLTGYKLSTASNLVEMLATDLASIISVDGMITETDGAYSVSIDAKKAVEMTENIKAVLPKSLKPIIDEYYSIADKCNVEDNFKKVVEALKKQLIDGVNRTEIGFDEDERQEAIDDINDELDFMVEEYLDDYHESIDYTEYEIDSMISDIYDLEVYEDSEDQIDFTVKKSDDVISLDFCAKSFYKFSDSTDNIESYSASVTIAPNTEAIEAPGSYTELGDFVPFIYNFFERLENVELDVDDDYEDVVPAED